MPVAPDPSRWYLAALVAVIAYLAALGGAGLIALGDARRDWDQALDDTLTLELPSDTSPARLEVVMALLRQSSGVVSAQPLDATQVARLLEPWLGKSVPVDIMPLPRLIDIGIDPSAIDLSGIQQRLHSVVPEARLEDHRLWLTRLLSGSNRLQAITALVVAAAAVAAALAVTIGARAHLNRNEELIRLLHSLGADDLDIAQGFVIPAAGVALLGGAVGALTAAGTLQAIVGAVRNLEIPPVVPSVADYRVILLLLAVTLASGTIAAAVAALAVRRRLVQLA